jgi:hypothetical protein
MKSDDLLLVIVVCGVVLTFIHLITEIVHWKAVKAANHRAYVQALVLYKRLHAATRTMRRKRPTKSLS